MSELRRLRPLILAKSRTKINPGPMPAPILLKLSQLRVNDQYQRTLSKDSALLGGKIACEFDWELFHMPVVSPIGENDEITGLPLYEIMDGQHTSIGAVTNGHIREIWCWPGRKDETLENRATSFRKLNTQRTAVTNVQLFWADVTAKNEEALEVIDACERTGAAVVKRTKPYGNMAVGETICVAPLMELAKRGGRVYVERVLRICMNVRLAPISKIWIVALTELLFNERSVNYVSGPSNIVDLEIENAIGRLGSENAEKTAKVRHAGLSTRDRQSQFWVLANIIKKEMKDHVPKL